MEITLCLCCQMGMSYLSHQKNKYLWYKKPMQMLPELIKNNLKNKLLFFCFWKEWQIHNLYADYKNWAAGIIKSVMLIFSSNGIGEKFFLWIWNSEHITKLNKSFLGINLLLLYSENRLKIKLTRGGKNIFKNTCVGNYSTNYKGIHYLPRILPNKYCWINFIKERMLRLDTTLVVGSHWALFSVNLR